MDAVGNQTFVAPRGPLPADSAEVAALAGHVRAGRCALFVGAGLSVPAGLPTWDTLIRRIVDASTPWAVDPALFAHPIDMEDPVADALRERPVAAIREALGPARFATLCRRIQRIGGGRLDLDVLLKALDVVFHDSTDRAELAGLAAERRYAELAGQCRDRFGRERFHALVRQALTTQSGLPATHRDIVRTPFSCVVTTNFDTLLEDAYARYGGCGLPRAPTGAELGTLGTLLLDRGFFVLKAHGDAARPDTMVFTADDYRRIIHANPAFQAIVSGILLTHAVLFVGYSLSDTNFRLLLDNHLTIFNGHVPPRYAILGGVGEAECEILWRTARLQVLPYPGGQHGEVGRCLAALAEQTVGDGSRLAVDLSPGAGARGVDAGTRAADAGSRAGKTGNGDCSTLFIESDGDRMTLELVRRRKGRDAERQWVGGALHPDTRPMGAWLRDADQAHGRGRSPMPDIRRVGARLAKLLPAPLMHALDTLPSRHVIEIACSAAATRIPWEWMRVAGEPVARRHAVMRRPVGITHEARGWRTVNRPLRALVFGDTGTGDGRGNMPLHFADVEARDIEAMLRAHSRHTTVTRLSREEATHERVRREIEGGDYDLIHVGGHAWFDDREAYFCFWDRIMLGSEIAPLLVRRPPALMVLDTHFTAFVLAEVDARVRELVGGQAAAAAPAPAGTPRGFAEAAMRCGVTSFVGAFGNVGDQSGADVSAAFYASLLEGVTVAEALRDARHRTARTSLDAGMFYTAFGYTDFRLVAPRRGRRAAATPLRRRGRGKSVP